MKIGCYLLSCAEREGVRRQTIANLASTDWNRAPVVEMVTTDSEWRLDGQTHGAWRLLRRAVVEGSELILFLEDDLQFNNYIRHNLCHWWPIVQLTKSQYFFASLYNPDVRKLSDHPERAYSLAHPESVYGSQALLLSQTTARYFVTYWGAMPGMLDIKLSRLAARVCSIHYHKPSLVQHLGYQSLWGGPFHYSRDFSVDWKA